MNPIGVIFNGRCFAGGGRISGGFNGAAGRPAKNAGVVRRDAAFADEAWRRQAVTYPLVDWGLEIPRLLQAVPDSSKGLYEADAEKENVGRRFPLRLRAPPRLSCAMSGMTGG